MSGSWLRFCSLPLGIACLLGCASPGGPLSLSLTELGSEVRSDGGSWRNDLAHRRAHNITGLGAADTVGMVSNDPDPPLIGVSNPFSRSFLPDQLALRLDNGCSKIVIRDFAGRSTQLVSIEDVLAVRNTLQAADGVALAVLQLRARKAIADELSDLVAQAEQSAASADADRDRADRLRGVLLKAWTDLGGGTAPATAKEWRDVSAGLGLQLDEATKAQEKSEKELAALQIKPGILVARWQHSASSESSQTMVGAAANRSASTQRQGFVVLGSPRTVTLMAGDDLAVRACRSSWRCRWRNGLHQRTGIDAMFDSNHLYTTTYQLLARHAAWVESGTFAQQSALSVQLKEIASIASGLSGVSAMPNRLLQAIESLNLKFSQAQQSLAAVTNMGSTSGGLETELQFSFEGDDEYAASVAAVREANKEFLQVVSMRSSLDAFAGLNPFNLLNWPKLVNPYACRGNAPVVAQVERMLESQLGCKVHGGVQVRDGVSREDVAWREAGCRQLPSLRDQVGRWVDEPVAAHVRRVLEAKVEGGCNEIRKEDPAQLSVADKKKWDACTQINTLVDATNGLLRPPTRQEAGGFQKVNMGGEVQVQPPALVPKPASVLDKRHD